jgi:hypothetical protein
MVSNVEVAERVAVNRMTVGKWRSRFLQHRLEFLQHRLEGLLDEERPGRPPSIALDRVEDVVVTTLEKTPRNDRSDLVTKQAPTLIITVRERLVSVQTGRTL